MSHRPRFGVGPVVALGVCAFVLAHTGSERAAAASDSDELIRRAARLYDAGEYEQAATLFAEADRAAGGRSLPAAAGLCRTALELERYDDAVGAAERWVELAPDPVERSAGLHHLGLALLRRGLDQRWHATRSEPADGTESLTLAADAFRRATAEAGGRRPSSLLALADTLVWLGQLDEARQVLEEYGAAGGRDRQAEDLRCWIAGAPYGQPAAADGSRADDGDLQPPIKRYAPAPQHTKAARVAGEAGLVILQAILDEEGTVRCVRVLRTDGLSREMIENTLATVKRWRFDPARRNGEAVGVYYTLTVRFG